MKGWWWLKPVSLLDEGKGMVHLIPVASQKREQNFFH